MQLKLILTKKMMHKIYKKKERKLDKLMVYKKKERKLDKFMV